MKARFIVVLVLIALAVIAIAAFWFFSSPAGVTRQQATSTLVTFAVQTLTLSAVVGFAAMATLEMLKRLFHLRGWFFLRRVPGSEFLRPARPFRPEQKGDPAQKKEKQGENGESPGADRAAEIIRFDIPLEQLMAQLGYATDHALDSLFSGRTESKPPPPESKASRPDAPPPAEPVTVSVPPPAKPAEGPDYKLLVRLVGQASVKKAQEGDDPTTLRLEVQAALDALQVSVGNAWRWWLRLTSCVLAAVFALAALVYAPVSPGFKTAALAGAFLLGGFFAGFFRDLAAIAERLRSLWADIPCTASQRKNQGRAATFSPPRIWTITTREIAA
jgi:hypothetical protein